MRLLLSLGVAGRLRLRTSPLSLIQINFAKEFFRNGGRKKEACKVFGLALTTVEHWFKDHIEFMEYIEDHREKLKKATQYDLKAAIDELDDAIQFARETENANALAKLIELKMKGHGLLIEKHDVRTFSAFSIKIAGIDDPVPLSPADVKVIAPGMSFEAVRNGETDSDDGEVDEERLWS